MPSATTATSPSSAASAATPATRSTPSPPSSGGTYDPIRRRASPVRQLDRPLDRAVAFAVPSPVELGLGVHRDRPAPPLPPPRPDRTRVAARLPMVRRPHPPHQLLAVRRPRRLLPRPRLLAGNNF